MRNYCIAAYAGSKNRIAKCYVPYIPYDGISTYIEPFGGMFGVGLNKSPHPQNIYNDKNPKLVLLMKVLSNRDTGFELLKSMCSVEYSEKSFAKALEHSNNFDKYNDSDIQKAVYIYTTLLMSYNGMMQKFRGIVTGTENEKFSYQIIKKYPLLDILNGLTVLEPQDGFSVIRQYNHRNDVFMLLDPPYPEKHLTGKGKRKKLYENEMLKNEEQLEFLNLIGDSTAKMLVCSYKNDLYDRVLCDGYGWKAYPLVHTYKSMRIGGAGIPKTAVDEYIYVNYSFEEINNNPYNWEV